jgi:hypothetical protein
MKGRRGTSTTFSGLGINLALSRTLRVDAQVRVWQEPSCHLLSKIIDWGGRMDNGQWGTEGAEDLPCSYGEKSPASMLRYGSILMEVTLQNITGTRQRPSVERTLIRIPTRLISFHLCQLCITVAHSETHVGMQPCELLHSCEHR